MVSTATGANKQDWPSIALLVLLSAAVFAVAPGVWDVTGTHDASLSITATSHVTHFPVLHGNCVTPSGRLPSVQLLLLLTIIYKIPVSVSASATLYVRTVSLTTLLYRAQRAEPTLSLFGCDASVITTSSPSISCICQTTQLLHQRDLLHVDFCIKLYKIFNMCNWYRSLFR